MLTFISNLVGVKADKAMQAGVEALVRWDPQSASEAELRTMEQHLDDLGRQVALARQSYDKEQKEAETRSKKRPTRSKRYRSSGWLRRSSCSDRSRRNPTRLGRRSSSTVSRHWSPCSSK